MSKKTPNSIENYNAGDAEAEGGGKEGLPQ